MVQIEIIRVTLYGWAETMRRTKHSAKMMNARIPWELSMKDVLYGLHGWYQSSSVCAYSWRWFILFIDVWYAVGRSMWYRRLVSNASSTSSTCKPSPLDQWARRTTTTTYHHQQHQPGGGGEGDKSPKIRSRGRLHKLSPRFCHVSKLQFSKCLPTPQLNSVFITSQKYIVQSPLQVENLTFFSGDDTDKIQLRIHQNTPF